MRVQAAILVDDQDERELAAGLGQSREITAHFAVAARGVDLDVLGFEARVVRPNLLGFGELGAQRFQQARGGHAADGELRRALEEAAAVERAVHVRVEELEHLRVKIARCLTRLGAGRRRDVR